MRALLLVFVLPLFLGGAQADSAHTVVADSIMAHLPVPGHALLAGLIPGGGQIYNRAWVKAILIAGAQVYFVTQFMENRDNYRDYAEDLPLPQYRYLEKRNKYAWWVVMTYIYGMIDGYVDAHLKSFPPKFEYNSDKSEQNMENQ